MQTDEVCIWPKERNKGEERREREDHQREKTRKRDHGSSPTPSPVFLSTHADSVTDLVQEPSPHKCMRQEQRQKREREIETFRSA